MRPSDAATPDDPFARLDKPAIVFVRPADATGDVYDKIQTNVFKNEKVALGVKAFRTVSMSPESVAQDPILAGAGHEVPRLLIVDPVKRAVTVLEKAKLRPGLLYGEMRSVVGHCYEDGLDAVVKAHLRLLTERDQLANQEKVLREKAARLADETGAKAERDGQEVAAQIAEVQQKLEDLGAREAKLWCLRSRLDPAHAAS